MKRRALLFNLCSAACYPAVAGLFTQSNMAEGQVFRKGAPRRLWKWSREAVLYEKQGGNTKCLVCPNHCELSPGDRSACRVKVNLDGTVYTLAYGNPSLIIAAHEALGAEPPPPAPAAPAARAESFRVLCAPCRARNVLAEEWNRV